MAKYLVTWHTIHEHSAAVETQNEDTDEAFDLARDQNNTEDVNIAPDYVMGSVRFSRLE